MPASIGVNLRVTGHCRQGGRKYMEDFFSVAYQQTEDEKDLEYAFFGIYDGHGGGEAATFAKEHLMESIVRQKNFWSDKDDDVLKAIKEGYIATHYAMWKEQEKWPKTASGLPSTAGTTASVAFIRRGKIYIGHVGDSGIILGYQEPGHPLWKARPLTKDHKPENESEMSRIEQCGGKVVTKSGVPRVVWNRPRIGHKGPVRRSTPIDEIPFLAVARSLGDLWSYNSALDEFVVSPDPDTGVIPIDTDTFRCLIFGTDGLWNMISPSAAVGIVQMAEQHNEKSVLAYNPMSKVWINPSKCLVERALERWSSTRMRADNTSVITLMLDPPGPPRAEVIKNQKLQSETCKQSPDDKKPPYPENGLEIVTVYREEPPPEDPLTSPTTSEPNEPKMEPKVEPLSPKSEPLSTNPPSKTTETTKSETTDVEKDPTTTITRSSKVIETVEPVKPAQKVKPSQPTPQTSKTVSQTQITKAQINKSQKPESELNETIQINEVSSSSCAEIEPEVVSEEPCARCTRSHDTIRDQNKKAQTRDRNQNPAQTRDRDQNPAQTPRETRRFTRGSKNVSPRASSESPKRKPRMSEPCRPVTRRLNTSKREHSDIENDQGDQIAQTQTNSRLSFNNEPPQKLRRSRSLGPRDFTLRSAANSEGRNLRDRTLKTPSNAAISKRLSNRSYTPARAAVQTRNRVRRLNK